MLKLNFKRTVALVIIATVALSILLTIGYKRTIAINMINSADTLVNSNPELALRVIRDVNVSPLLGSANRAKYSLLHTKILDKNYIDVTTDSIINYAVKYYSKKGTAAQKAEMYYYRGILYLNLDDKDKSIEFMVNAKAAAKVGDNNYLKGLIANTLGNIYFKEGSFNNAIEEFKESAVYFGEYGDEYKVANAYSFVGKCYNLLKEDKLELEYLEKAKSLYLKLNRIDEIILLNSALAGIYLNNSEPEKAVTCLLDDYRKYNNSETPKKDYAIWARIYLAKGDYVRAKDYVTKIYSSSTLTLREKAGALAILKDIEIANKNYTDALEYYNKYNELIYENYDREKRAFVEGTIAKYNRQRQQDAYDALQLEYRYQRIIYSIAIFIFFIAFAIVVIYQIKKREALRLKLEKERRENSLLAEEMQEEISSLKEQYNLVLEELEDSEEDTHLLNAFEFRMNQLKEIMERAYVTEDTPLQFHNEFKSYVRITKNGANNFDDIRYLVDKKYNGLVSHTVALHPNLTEQEIDLFSMLCFGFSSNVIRLIYGHKNLDSIFSKRKKLRAKLELKESLKLESYIKNLKEEFINGKKG